jgi:hypothetical protein
VLVELVRFLQVEQERLRLEVLERLLALQERPELEPVRHPSVRLRWHSCHQHNHR